MVRLWLRVYARQSVEATAPQQMAAQTEYRDDNTKRLKKSAPGRRMIAFSQG
jgi:hypothetical protein